MRHERGEVPMLVVDKDRRMSRKGRRIETNEGIVDI
jgi:flagellar biosynthesis/type III secretory pathway protein FliH